MRCQMSLNVIHWEEYSSTSVIYGQNGLPQSNDMETWDKAKLR